MTLVVRLVVRLVVMVAVVDDVGGDGGRAVVMGMGSEKVEGRRRKAVHGGDGVCEMKRWAIPVHGP